MTKQELKDKIDLDITNKISANSISPLNVGSNMKAVVDLILSEAPEDGLIYGRQDGEWSEVTSGGLQDLQSVLDIGGIFENLEGDYVDILGTSDYRNITFEIKGVPPSSGDFSTGGRISIDDTGSSMSGGIDTNISSVTCTDIFEISRANLNGRTFIRINDRPGLDANVAMFINFPGKIGGTYTIATLDDIYKITNLQIYPDNASAILGGLTTDEIYKTSTGELRIVI